MHSHRHKKFSSSPSHDRASSRFVAVAVATGFVAFGLVGCGSSAEDTTPAPPTNEQSEPTSVNGGTFATELVGQTEFADEPDAPATGKQALQEVKGGRLVLTNLGPGLAWQSSEAASAPGSSAVFVAGEMQFGAEQVASGAPITAAGVGVGSTSNEWDYFLTCNTAGVATLQRSSDTDAVKLGEYDNVGCGDTFSLGLEAHSPGAGNTELLLTLPDGSTQTVTDDADYGPFMYYGLMVYGDEYPATASALSARAYVAP